LEESLFPTHADHCLTKQKKEKKEKQRMKRKETKDIDQTEE
jgi:hypothetical protein